jgi:hypothetical protein
MLSLSLRLRFFGCKCQCKPFCSLSLCLLLCLLDSCHFFIRAICGSQHEEGFCRDCHVCWFYLRSSFASFLLFIFFCFAPPLKNLFPLTNKPLLFATWLLPCPSFAIRLSKKKNDFYQTRSWLFRQTTLTFSSLSINQHQHLPSSLSINISASISINISHRQSSAPVITILYSFTPSLLTLLGSIGRLSLALPASATYSVIISFSLSFWE